MRVLADPPPNKQTILQVNLDRGTPRKPYRDWFYKWNCMTETRATNIWTVPLPWSDGSLSAKMWQKGRRVVVGVPELDILCTGKSQSEATFRLFTTLLKYYRQLKASAELDERQQEHMRLLKDWVESVERKMTHRELTPVR